MSYYILVEGYRTEMQVYPSWLNHLKPELERLQTPDLINADDQYFIISGGGYPTILNQIEKSLDDIEEYKGYTNFIVIVDSEELDLNKVRNEIRIHIEKEKNSRDIFNLNTEVIIQKKCIETWFLGNKDVFKENPTDLELKEFINYFHVRDENPEEMGSYTSNTSAQFHLLYLQKMLKERNISYTKKYPRGVTEKTYLESLIKRVRESDGNDLKSFKFLIDYFS